MTSGFSNNLYQDVLFGNSAIPKVEEGNLSRVLNVGQGHQCASVDGDAESRSANLQTPIIVGLSSADLNERHQHLYMCDHSVFLEAAKILTVHSVRSVGVALPYLYAGDGCRYVWHLQNHGSAFHLLGSYPRNGRNKVWFVLEAFAVSSLNSLVTGKLKCQLISTLFKREVSGLNLSRILSPSCQYEETPVQMIADDPLELQAMCLSSQSSHLTLSSILTNAMTFVQEIRINLDNLNMSERRGTHLTSSVLKCLLGLCTVTSASARAELETTSSAAPDLPQTIITHVPDNSIQVDESHIKIEASALSGGIEGEENVGMGIKETSWDDDGSGPILGQVSEPSASVTPSNVTTCSESVLRFRTERFLLVECPLCGMTYRSSKNRVQSLISHIHRRHPDNRDVLLKVVKKKYQSSVGGRDTSGYS